MKFCTVSSGASSAGNLPFLGTLLRQKPQIGPIGHHREVLPIGCISLPHRKCHATDAPLVEYRAACGLSNPSPHYAPVVTYFVDIRPSPKTDVLVRFTGAVRAADGVRAGLVARAGCSALCRAQFFQRLNYCKKLFSLHGYIDLTDHSVP